MAKQVVHDPYLGDGETYGGKGWDYHQHDFVSTSTIGTGYTYWNNGLGGLAFGAGLDCSGLTMWAYDRAHDPVVSHLNNFMAYEGATGQYYSNSVSVTQAQLQPGDLMFLGTANGSGQPRMYHVAMYVGGDSSTDVVQAESPTRGIRATSLAGFESIPDFYGFRAPTTPQIAMKIVGHSPINLAVIDPEGDTINQDSVASSSSEYAREAPGQLYYSDVGIDAQGYPEPVVYSPVYTPGVYHVKVSPLPGAAATSTYSLDFTTGSTTISLAQDVPLSKIPRNGYGVVVSATGTPVLDVTPPEATIGFSTTTQQIEITGTDNLSTTTVASTATSTTVTDAAGNWLTVQMRGSLSPFKVAPPVFAHFAQKFTHKHFGPGSASFVIRSLGYSTGTSTTPVSSLHYFWSTSPKGKYTIFTSFVTAPTSRYVAVYNAFMHQTQVMSLRPKDRLTLSARPNVAALFVHLKPRVYPGLAIPELVTNKGAVTVQWKQ